MSASQGFNSIPLCQPESYKDISHWRKLVLSQPEQCSLLIRIALLLAWAPQCPAYLLFFWPWLNFFLMRTLEIWVYWLSIIKIFFSFQIANSGLCTEPQVKQTCRSSSKVEELRSPCVAHDGCDRLLCPSIQQMTIRKSLCGTNWNSLPTLQKKQLYVLMFMTCKRHCCSCFLCSAKQSSCIAACRLIASARVIVSFKQKSKHWSGSATQENPLSLNTDVSKAHLFVICLNLCHSIPSNITFPPKVFHNN